VPALSALFPRKDQWRLHGRPLANGGLRLLLGLSLTFATVAFAGATDASAAPSSSCDPFATTPVAGGTYNVQENEWNSDATQCVSTDGGADFTVTASAIDSQSASPGSYPSIYRGCHWGTCTEDSGLPIEVSSLVDPISSWSTTEPTTGVFDAAYDIWFSESPTTDGPVQEGTELMVWLTSNGGVQPEGSKVATVSLDGLDFGVWYNPSLGVDYVAYVVQGGTPAVDDIDLGVIARDAEGRGYLSPSSYLIDVEAGFEIWQGGTGLATNSFSFDPGTTAVSGEVSRIYGADAVGTSIAVSQAEYPAPQSAGGVVLARSDFFSDGLAGGPLAAKVRGPLLLTPGVTQSTMLDPRVTAEIERVLPRGGTVCILGGVEALSPTIDPSLEALGFATQRLAGGDEYATAVDVAEELGNPPLIFEATGLDFADALSAVPAAIDDGGAILLTDGSSQAPETAAYLTQHPSDSRYAIGGPLAASGADPSAAAVYGTDLYGTSAAVASTFFAAPGVFGAATSATFPDALSAGVMMGASRGPMLLVAPDGPLAPYIAVYLQSVSDTVRLGTVFGGPLAVGEDVVSELDSAIAPNVAARP